MVWDYSLYLVVKRYNIIKLRLFKLMASIKTGFYNFMCLYWVEEVLNFPDYVFEIDGKNIINDKVT